MSDPNQPANDPAGLRGPGDPEAAKERQQQSQPDAAEARPEQTEPAPEPAKIPGEQADSGSAGNIREEQLTQAAGTVPAAYVGSGDPTSGDKPEDAVDSAGGWDDET
ncbi:hypothetical protein [uncultured Arthrobacter sp.]|mgnify:CR=1 FL=1|uniref:hypothetical protein n=1 Tax=uncultured Arthrobacter sp. TaxID=114050 RepID=UPI0032166244